MISVAHSPDSDDFFFFWALSKGLIIDGGLTFSFSQYDTETLNQRALAGLDDVVAVSAALYPAIEGQYAILEEGASIGRNFGPVIVAKTPLSVSELDGLVVGIPGENTTAAALFRHFLPNSTTVVIPIFPYERIFSALSANEVQAAVLIHEGQQEYKKRGLFLVKDLGQWWFEKTSLPLPLGINVIRRALGLEIIHLVSSLIRSSIAYALKHRDEAVNYLADLNLQRGTGFTDPEDISAYLDCYANDDSLVLRKDAKEGFKMLVNFLQRAT